MRRIDINGISYAAPFADLLRPLSGPEWSSLIASVNVNGVMSNLQVANTPSWGRCLLDGWHRATIAEPLDIDVPVTNRGEMSDEKAREIALSLNLDRRHSTQEEQQALRERRIDRAVAARKQGDSLAVIAKKEGVSRTQIVRDLLVAESVVESVVPGGTVAEFATQIVGIDARVYQPRKRRVRPKQIDRAHKTGESFAKALRAILKGPNRERFERILAELGISLGSPTHLTPAERKAGQSQPSGFASLDLLRVAVRNLAQGAVTA